jgi:hypothetical protein
MSDAPAQPEPLLPTYPDLPSPVTFSGTIPDGTPLDYEKYYNLKEK